MSLFHVSGKGKTSKVRVGQDDKRTRLDLCESNLVKFPRFGFSTETQEIQMNDPGTYAGAEERGDREWLSVDWSGAYL